MPWDCEAIQQSQDDSLINSIINEVMKSQVTQVIIQAWRDVADVDRSKQVKKATDITCILQTSVKFHDFEEMYL